jgi:hypothetical protein
MERSARGEDTSVNFQAKNAIEQQLTRSPAIDAQGGIHVAARNDSEDSPETKKRWPIRALFAGATVLTLAWIGFLGWLAVHLVWFVEQFIQ